MNLPLCCDGCSSLDHALCYRKDGLIIQRYNEIHDFISDLAALVWGWVFSEPVVKDASEDSDALIADLGGIGGLWQSKSMALFDTHIAPCLICPILLLLCWLQLNLKRNGSIALLLLIIALPSHLYVFRLMDLLMIRPIVFGMLFVY